MGDGEPGAGGRPPGDRPRQQRASALPAAEAGGGCKRRRGGDSGATTSLGLGGRSGEAETPAGLGSSSMPSALAIDGSISLRSSSPCRRDDNSHCGNKITYSGPELPGDIWRHIHFLLPMQDAASAACVSQSFLASWRCYPNLIFTNETMCSKENLRNRTVGSNGTRDYNNNIHHVLTNHSGAGVRKFRLEYHVPYDAESYHRLSSWLQIAVTPSIEELNLEVWPKEATFISQKRKKKATFNFPITLLSDMCKGLMRHLHLANLDLHPTFQLGLRSLKTLHLHGVHITEDELGCLLSNSFALAHLRLQYCHDIIRLEIPCLLQRLRFLEVLECSLEVLEINAPNISRFRLIDFNVQLSLGKSRKMNVISYAIDNLPSCAPKVETLTIHSSYEVSRVQSKYDWFEGDPSSLRQISEHRHRNLKSVKISSFCPQKSMVELACNILENATSLEYLTLDTTPISHRCSGDILGRKCPRLDTACIRDAHESLLAVRTYIDGKVPSTVKLSLLGPCTRCYAL